MRRIFGIAAILLFTALLSPVYALTELRIDGADATMSIGLRSVDVPTIIVSPENLFIGTADAELTWDLHCVEVTTERERASVLFVGCTDAETTINLSPPWRR